MDSSGTAHPGLLTGADMARFDARHEAPVTADFHDWTVAKCGPWSQGPVFLQQLRMLEQSDLGAFLSADHIHLVTECAKLAFADREAWYADPDFAPVPLDGLLSHDYGRERRSLVGDRASLDLRPGRPAGLEPGLPRRVTHAVSPRHAVVGAHLAGVSGPPRFPPRPFPGWCRRQGASRGRCPPEPMAAGVLDELRRRGHEVVEAEAWSLGRTCAVGIDPDTNLLSAGANPRGGQAYAVGR